MENNDVNIVEKRLESLEERFGRTEEKVIQLDKSISVYSAVFERTIQIQEKLSNSIDKLSETTAGLQTTLIGVQKDIARNNEGQESNSSKINRIEEVTNNKIHQLEIKLHEKLGGFAKELNEVDDKGKFDFVRFAKENFVSFILFLYIIYSGIEKYFITTK